MPQINVSYLQIVVTIKDKYPSDAHFKANGGFLFTNLEIILLDFLSNGAVAVAFLEAGKSHIRTYILIIVAALFICKILILFLVRSSLYDSRHQISFLKYACFNFPLMFLRIWNWPEAKPSAIFQTNYYKIFGRLRSGRRGKVRRKCFCWVVNRCFGLVMLYNYAVSLLN